MAVKRTSVWTLPYAELEQYKNIGGPRHARRRQDRLYRMARRRPAGHQGFYTAAFGWSFTDYGPDYAAFEGQGADGGFTTPQEGSTDRPLVVLYAHDIEAMLAKVTAAGGDDHQADLQLPGRPPLPLHRPVGQRAGGVERPRRNDSFRPAGEGVGVATDEG
jgi:hypothetical protein